MERTRTYHDVAIEQMLGTVADAMGRVIDYWADLPPPMKDAIEQFRTRLGAAIDSVEFVRKALTEKSTGQTATKAQPGYRLLRCAGVSSKQSSRRLHPFQSDQARFFCFRMIPKSAVAVFGEYQVAFGRAFLHRAAKLGCDSRIARARAHASLRGSPKR
jgi:hypothetical protein